MALNLTITHEFCSIFIRNTVKQGRYLTPSVSSDEIQHDHPLPWQPSSVVSRCKVMWSQMEMCNFLGNPVYAHSTNNWH